MAVDLEQGEYETSFNSRQKKMTTARMIEYRITQDLLRRRERATRQRPADRLIKSLAVFAGIAIAAVCLPQLLLPFLAASIVIILGS